MLVRPRRWSVPLLSCLVLVLVAVFSGPVSSAVDYSTIKINEVQSEGTDTIELINTGAAAVDISGLVLKDETEEKPFTIPSSTTIAGHGFAVFNALTFGLGKGDSARLFDGTTLLDTTTWPSGTHAQTWGRCTDGTGPFGVTAATFGAANACVADPTKVKINEVKTNPNPDFVELVNTGSLPIDITGWKAVDNEAGRVPTAVTTTPTTIASGGYFSFTPSFGLGDADSITIFLANGTTQIDTYSWTVHPLPSAVRCPEGSGAFVLSAVATPGAKNSCPLPDGGANIKINEVESDPNDKVELVNTGSTPVDLSGYVLKDEGTVPFLVPGGTTIGAHAYLVIDTSPVFKFGKGDSARLFAPDGETLIDSTTWPADTHATNWGRCADGTGAFGVTTPTLGSANECGAPVDPTTAIRINEIESNGDKVADWVELTNTSTSTIDVSGWKILDNDAAHVTTPVVVPAATKIAPGAFYAIYTELNQSPGFGLGGADSVTLLLPDGTTSVDTYTWATHAPTTYGRCPDGVGAIKTTTTSTRGAPNACSPVRINEIESDAGTSADWVELVNISDVPVDVSGWTVKDSTDIGSVKLAAGTTIAAKAYTVVEGLTLDDGDTVRLFQTDGTTVAESYAWTNPAAVTYARCKDGLGDFVNATAATKGAANACPGLDTEPWPGSQNIRTADLEATFVQDLSGLAFDPKNSDILWAAQNKLGTLFKLKRDGQNWVPDTSDGWTAGKTPKYTDGTGAPDTEGLTIGPDGFIYAASERNNSASGVSRMSVLRYDPSATGTTLTATDEWDLTSKIPSAGANLGLEGTTWVPDSFLTAGGFLDQSTGTAYKPSDYPLHGTGLYIVAVEDTGALHAFALDSSGGTSHKIATISSGFPHLADVVFDPERQRLWAVTDDTHDGKTSLLKLQAGAFTVSEAYDRPATMPNLNNEGLAISPQSTCVNGFKEVLWSDDGDTGGHSLRSGTISCTAVPAPVAQDVKFTSVPPASPVFGQSYAVTATGGASGQPIVLRASDGCSIDGSTVRFAVVGVCTVTAAQAAAPGYLAGSAQQTIQVGKASTGTAVSVLATKVTAKVSILAPGAGIAGGMVEFRVGAGIIGFADLVDGTAALTYAVPAGADRNVTAIYVGNDAFTGSTGTALRRDPIITATVSPSRPGSGWYTSPVTVSFSCTTQGAPLVDDCPAAVTLAGDGAKQSATRTIAAVDGGQATTSVTDINIDRVAPTVRVGGVTQGKLYVGKKPSAACVGIDTLSGIASCIITTKVTPTRTTLTATATDRAGNVSRSASVSYRTLAYEVKGATYRGGKFHVKPGKTYTLAAAVTASGRVYGPARLGTIAKATQRLSGGTAKVTIPRSAKIGSTWKIQVKADGTTRTIKLKLTR